MTGIVSAATGNQVPPASTGINTQHTIDINALSGQMIQKIGSQPKLLKKAAGERSCCIFRVPQSLVDINSKAYYPQIVSIGPYHHGEVPLKMIEEHKWKYLHNLLSRMQPNNHATALNQLLNAIVSEEANIRKSYSEAFDAKFGSGALVQMMVLDGIFVIELLCKVGKVVKVESDDPIFNLEWVLSFLQRDLVALENQIPFDILKILFRETAPSRSTARTHSLTKLALKFFNLAVQRPNRVIDGLPDDLEGVHLLDLFRLSFIKSFTPTNQNASQSSSQQILQLVPSASKLRRAGIRFKVRKADSFLDIKYSCGALMIPQVTIDDMTRAFFLNLVAFEQCYKHCSKYMTDYSNFIARLINTPSDAEFLCDRQIIENYLGAPDELTSLFNNICKDVSFDLEGSYLLQVYEDVNKFRKRWWWRSFAELWDTYFHSPWSFLSMLAAMAILALTATQVYYAVHPVSGDSPSTK